MNDPVGVGVGLVVDVLSSPAATVLILVGVFGTIAVWVFLQWYGR